MSDVFSKVDPACAFLLQGGLIFVYWFFTTPRGQHRCNLI